MDDFSTSITKALSDGYTIERELGGGGMSRTYLAREHALSRRVVVKVLSPELLQGISVERFRREILLAAGLQHPHVVPVLAAGVADGMPWFTMPYVDGESLRMQLEKGSIGIGEAVGILRDVARALAYAHSQGVVHRDIKPDNVLLSAGSATVTDFGIAKAITASRTDGGASATLTQAGMAIGTPAYMAPEQAAGDPDLDSRADLYSFGAMAYELLTGRQVFAGLTPARQLVAHLSQEPRDPRELRADIPPVLAELVMRCLAKEPAMRPSDAATMARVLDSVATSGVSTAAPMALMTPRLPLGKALALWTGITVAVVLVAWAATEVIGLPEWALPGAAGVMLAGLPAILVTWWIQRTARRIATLTPARTSSGSRAAVGPMATFALKASPHVSWTRTWRLGASAVVVFVLLVSGFMVTRAMGIGPAASLMGKGAFGETEAVVVADFRSPAGDTLLGVTVGEALRTDLGQSANLRVMSRSTVREILQRMMRPTESAVLFPVAREIATREGAKAVVDGEVLKIGATYVLTARLVSSADGSELATFRETAANDDALIESIGKLSRDIREKVGESLKDIRASSPVERVTTPSLPALRKYMEGINAEETTGDMQRAVQSYEQAVALDTGFSMAWRKLGVVLRNNGLGREKAARALSAAWRFRDRLSDEERAITEGTYYTYGPEPDPEKARAAYEQLLSRDSTNRTALINVAVIDMSFRRFDRAMAMYAIVERGTNTGAVVYQNLQVANLSAGRPAATQDSIEARLRARFPTNVNLWEATGTTLWAHDRLDSLEKLARDARRSSRSRRQEVISLAFLEQLASYQGRKREAMAFSAEAALAGARDAGGASAPADGSARAWMRSAIDSATYAVLLGGDDGLARGHLRSATSQRAVDAVPPADRDWADLAVTAALTGDSVAARVAREGYARDNMPVDPYRTLNAPRLDASAALASGKWAAAIEALGRSIRQEETPNVEEAFLMGMAHDRAGRPDSAIAWYVRAAKTGDGAKWGVAYYWPAAHRRLGELYDEQGDARKAIEHYEWFANRWKNADPELQPTVRAVKARAAALKQKLAPG